MSLKLGQKTKICSNVSLCNVGLRSPKLNSTLSFAAWKP